MTTRRFAVPRLVWGMTSMVSAVGVASDPIDRQLPQLLVLAHVVECRKESPAPGFATNLLVVAKTYCGGQEHDGERFSVVCQQRAASAHERKLRGPWEVGDELILPLKCSDGELRVVWKGAPPHRFRPIVLPNGGAPEGYDSLAKAMGQAWNADRTRPLEILIDYASDPHEEVATWATRSIADIADQLVTHLMRLSREEPLSPGQSTILDESLCRLRGNAWRESDGRFAMLTRWLNCTDEGAVRLLLSRLAVAAQKGELSFGTVARLADIAKAREGIPDHVIARLCFIVGQASERSRAAEGFEYLVRTSADTTLSQEIRGTAISAMGAFFEMTPARKGRVEAVAEKADEPDIQRALLGLLKGDRRKEEKERLERQMERFRHILTEQE